MTGCLVIGTDPRGPSVTKNLGTVAPTFNLSTQKAEAERSRAVTVTKRDRVSKRKKDGQAI